MEAVPKMPMISIDLKLSAGSADFGPKIREYVSKFYGDNSDAYDREIEELEMLRENAMKANRDLQGCATLKKYFGQLQLLRSRFPMSPGDPVAIPFVWFDKYFEMPNPVAFEDVGFELACVMHNVGAIHSVLGALDSRTTAEGMKLSCTHFQCAAYAFQQLRDQLHSSHYSVDFDKNLLSWYLNLMLAQAQECILEKSLLDQRKNAIIAKIAVQIVEFYKLCHKHLNQDQLVQDIVGSSAVKNWTRFIDMKSKYYLAIAYLHLGNQAEEQQKMGERLCYYQAASTNLAESAKLAAKQESEVVKSALQFASDVINGKLNVAKKENDFIYHEKIPTLDSLPEVKGASLVKCIPFDALEGDCCGPDIFARLVPLEVHQSASLYSEEKAKIIREAVSRAEQKDLELNKFLAVIQADKLHLNDSGNQAALPQALVERCAKMNAKAGRVNEATAKLEKIINTSAESESTAAELQRSFKGLRDEIAENEKTFGKAEIFAKFVAEIGDLETQLARYQGAHTQAATSNAELNRVLTASLTHLHQLAQPLEDLKNFLPPGAVSGGDTPAGAQVKLLLSKVEEMRTQRGALLDQLRVQIQADDITKLLLASMDKSMDEVFTRELRKHDKLVGLVDQNLAAQVNIISALTDANAKYAEIRMAQAKSEELREATISSLINAYESFMDVSAKIDNGEEFFTKLTEVLNDVKMKLGRLEEEKSAAVRQLKAEADEKLNAAKVATEAEETRKLRLLEQQKLSVAAGMAPLTTPPIPSVAKAEGPKLKDYMEYYRAKKAGQEPSGFPGSTQTPVAPAGSAQSPGFQPVFPPECNYNPAVLSMPTTPYQPVGPTSVNPYYFTPYDQFAQNAIPPSAQFLQTTQTRPVAPSPPVSNSYQQYQSVAQTATPTVQSSFTTTTFPGPSQTSGVPVNSMQTSMVRPPPGGYCGTSAASHNFNLPASSYSQPFMAAPTVTAVTSGRTSATPSFTYGGNQQFIPPDCGPHQQYQNFMPSGQPQNPQMTPLYSGAAQHQYQQYSTPQTAVPQSHPAQMATTSSQSSFNNWSGYNQHNSVPPQQSGVWQQQQSAPQTSTQTAYVPQQSAPGQPVYQQSFTQTSNVQPQSYGAVPPASMSNSTQYQPAYQPTTQQFQSAASMFYQPSVQYQTAQVNSSASQPHIMAATTYGVQPGAQSYLTAQHQVVSGPSQHNYSGGQSAPIPPASLSHVVDSTPILPAPLVPISSAPPKTLVPPVNLAPNAVVEEQERSAKDSTTKVLLNSDLAGLDIVQPQQSKSARVAANKTADGPLATEKPRQPPTADISSPTKKTSTTGLFDPLADDEVLNRFIIDVERMEKYVEGLTRKCLNGPTNLETKWKELLAKQDSEAKCHSISVARCYPQSNRFPDIMPYDASRVILKTARDDYINASHIRKLSEHSPAYIATQAPLKDTQKDFWLMAFEQQIELIVAILVESEFGCQPYWPDEKLKTREFGPLSVTLQTQKVHEGWVERIIRITHNEKNQTRSVVHLQFVSWPISGTPTNAGPFMTFLIECTSYFYKQRSFSRPILVHCTSGVGRTGVFCLLCSAVCEMKRTGVLPQIVPMVEAMRECRKWMIFDQKELLFAYDALLHFAQELLMKRGIITNRTSFDEIQQQATVGKIHSRHGSQDFLLFNKGLSVPALQQSLSSKKAEDKTKEQRESPRRRTFSQKEASSSANSETSKDSMEAHQIPPDPAQIPVERQEIPPLPVALEPIAPVVAELKESQPISLVELTDPTKFQLDSVQPSKKKVTKADFVNRTGEGALEKRDVDPSDPFGNLDPLWSLRK